MQLSEDRSGADNAVLGRVLHKDFFLYLLDHEVKRALRYQNFVSILLLRLVPSSLDGNGRGLEECHQTLTQALITEMRETDILGSLGKNGLAALLPYADVSAGTQVKARFEKTLDYYDFKNKGYGVTVDYFCYPRNGAGILEMIKKAMDGENSQPGEVS